MEKEKDSKKIDHVKQEKQKAITQTMIKLKVRSV